MSAGLKFSYSFLFYRLLLGLRTNWQSEYISVLGMDWGYQDAMVGKVFEGFYEAGLQMLLQVRDGKYILVLNNIA